MRLRDCSPFSRMKHPPSAVSSSWESIIQAPGSVRILQVSLSVFVHSCSRMVLRCTAPCLGAAGSMGSWCCGAHGWVLCLGGERLLVPLSKHQLLPATCVPAIAVCLQELGWEGPEERARLRRVSCFWVWFCLKLRICVWGLSTSDLFFATEAGEWRDYFRHFRYFWLPAI